MENVKDFKLHPGSNWNPLMQFKQVNPKFRNVSGSRHLWVRVWKNRVRNSVTFPSDQGRGHFQRSIPPWMLNINSQNMRIKFRVLIWSHNIEIVSRLADWHLSACFSLKYNTLAKQESSWIFKWDFLFGATIIWFYSHWSLLSLCQIILLYNIKSSYRYLKTRLGSI